MAAEASRICMIHLNNNGLSGSTASRLKPRYSRVAFNQAETLVAKARPTWPRFNHHIKGRTKATFSIMLATIAIMPIRTGVRISSRA